LPLLPKTTSAAFGLAFTFSARRRPPRHAALRRSARGHPPPRPAALRTPQSSRQDRHHEGWRRASVIWLVARNIAFLATAIGPPLPSGSPTPLTQRFRRVRF